MFHLSKIETENTYSRYREFKISFRAFPSEVFGLGLVKY